MPRAVWGGNGMTAGQVGTGRRCFKRVQTDEQGVRAWKMLRATQSKLALGHGAQKTFSNMPFAFRKQNNTTQQNSFVFLSSETSCLTRKHLYLEITEGAMDTAWAVAGVLLEQCRTFCGSDRFITLPECIPQYVDQPSTTRLNWSKISAVLKLRDCTIIKIHGGKRKMRISTIVEECTK